MDPLIGIQQGLSRLGKLVGRAQRIDLVGGGSTEAYLEGVGLAAETSTKLV